MPFLSALEDRAWKARDRGWELLEHHDRAAEVQRRQEAEGRVRGLFAGDNDLTRTRCAEEIARLHARYPLDPKERSRSWEGWWGTGLSSCQPIQRPVHFMCCRVSNLIQTLEVIVTEPAIPAERSEAKVPNAPDGQIPLGLWPDRGRIRDRSPRSRTPIAPAIPRAPSGRRRARRPLIRNRSRCDQLLFHR